MNAAEHLERVRLGMAAPALDPEQLVRRAEAVARARTERFGIPSRIRRDQEFLQRLEQSRNSRRKEASNG